MIKIVSFVIFAMSISLACFLSFPLWFLLALLSSYNHLILQRLDKYSFWIFWFFPPVMICLYKLKIPWNYKYMILCFQTSTYSTSYPSWHRLLLMFCVFSLLSYPWDWKVFEEGKDCIHLFPFYPPGLFWPLEKAPVVAQTEAWRRYGQTCDGPWEGRKGSTRQRAELKMCKSVAYRKQ